MTAAIRPLPPVSAADVRRLAERYHAARLHAPSVAESDRVFAPAAHDELALQAVLFNGDMGARWTSEDGRAVEVIDWGRWNREAGPDFKAATIEFEGGERIRGDIELDLDARDWDRHGHSDNPDFENVALHFFVRTPRDRYFTRTRAHREIVQIRLPGSPGQRGRMQPASRSATIPVDDVLKMLRAAAACRMRRKAGRFHATTRLHGRHNALFFHLAAGLGYKPNKIPFLLLAQRTGWKRAAGADGEALLFGLAGFLRPDAFDQGDAETRSHLRELWERWWPCVERESRLVLPPRAWKFSGIRPANHPHRRLGALKGIAGCLTSLGRAVDRCDPEAFAEKLLALTHPFWRHRWNLKGARLDRECALLGEGRVRDLLVNVFYPLAINGGSDMWTAFETVALMESPARMKHLAAWLCPDLPNSLLRAAWVQQGLLQLDEDFPDVRDPAEIHRRLFP